MAATQPGSRVSPLVHSVEAEALEQGSFSMVPKQAREHSMGSVPVLTLLSVLLRRSALLWKGG